MLHAQARPTAADRRNFVPTCIVIVVACIVTLAAGASSLHAAQLPQDHEYQRVIRDFLVTLTIDDFDHGVEGDHPFAVVPREDLDDAYRDYMLLRGDLLPIIGTKRGAPCVTAPADAFLLSLIERDEFIRVPPVWAEPIAWLVRWDNEGNPLFNSRAMKLRAFTKMAVEIIMTDDQFEHRPEMGMNRTDWFGPHMLSFAYPYKDVRDVLPKNVQQAYETALVKMARRQLDWGPKGEEVNQDLVGVVGLWYVANVIDDSKLKAEIDDHIRYMLASEDKVHPAGYFVDRHGLDMSFNGMSAFLANWIALAGSAEFAEQAVDKRYRLRSHLILREPNGREVGPSHFNARLDSDASNDQWKWGYRDWAGAMLTDEAVYLTTFPTREEMDENLKKAVNWFNFGVAQTPRRRTAEGRLIHLKPEEISAPKWAFRPWPSHNYPIAVCYAWDFYRKGTYARMKKLHDEDSRWLRSPFERGETFIRHFADAFTVARKDNFAAIIHTGPVGYDDRTQGIFHHEGPYGYGGGQLSAFWTPDAGSVILGRRGGMGWDNNYDKVEEWKIWPIHAVTGVTHEGKVFTSSRIRKPDVKTEGASDHAVVTASGRIPPEILDQGKVLQGRIDYIRVFNVTDAGVKITTAVRAFGQDKIAEMYETLPIFPTLKQGTDVPAPATIEFKVGGAWTAATPDFVAGVTAVRVKRFAGGIEITFDQPRRAALAPTPFGRGFISNTPVRNILIDLLDNAGEPVVFNDQKTVTYDIRPLPPQTAAIAAE